jgi:hybrid cluster-associated redox disulfide protein
MTANLSTQLTMADLLAGWPAAGHVLAKRGMACVGCSMARFETIEEAAVAYGFDPAELLGEISRAVHTRSRRSSSS